jgi:hypothetical protein
MKGTPGCSNFASAVAAASLASPIVTPLGNRAVGAPNNIRNACREGGDTLDPFLYEEHQ